MAFKDLINNLRDYFVEDDEDFDETPAPAQRPTVVHSAASSTTKEQASASVSKPKQQPKREAPVRPQMQNQSQQAARSQSRPYVAPQEKTLEKKQMNQNIVAQQAQVQAGQTIAIKEPRAYADIMEAARIVKNGECVLVNFKFMGDTQARRSIDFMTGVAFTLDGDIQNVGGQIFLMTPAHITVDAAREMSMLAGQNFENYDIY